MIYLKNMLDTFGVQLDTDIGEFVLDKQLRDSSMVVYNTGCTRVYLVYK